MNMGEFMRYLLTLATLLVGLVLASTTYAALLSKDSTFGPNTITRDTDTGLDWLDLTLSTNRSYDDIPHLAHAAGAAIDPLPQTPSECRRPSARCSRG